MAAARAKTGTGTKTGGRAKGTPNKSTVAKREGIERLLDSGCDPYRAMYELAQHPDTPLDDRMSLLRTLMKYSYRELLAESDPNAAGGGSETSIIAIALNK